MIVFFCIPRLTAVLYTQLAARNLFRLSQFQTSDLRKLYWFTLLFLIHYFIYKNNISSINYLKDYVWKFADTSFSQIELRKTEKCVHCIDTSQQKNMESLQNWDKKWKVLFIYERSSISPLKYGIAFSFALTEESKYLLRYSF